VAEPSIRVLGGDARSVPAIGDRSVHLVVTSPPYPKIALWDALFASLGATSFEAMHEVLAAAWSESYRVLVEGGILAVNIGDAVRSDATGFRLWPNHVRTSQAAEAAGFRPLPYILWKKPTNKPNAFLGSGFLPPNAYVTMDCEFILLFRKGGLRSFPRHDPVRAASRYSRPERDQWFSQVWEGIRGIRQGPELRRSGAFPEEIPERLIRMFSCAGDTVLDPFAGSGTTLWVAHRLGRSAIGVELDAHRVDALRTRAECEAGAATRRPGPPRGARAPRRQRA
jgi:DNA modification methylase